MKTPWTLLPVALAAALAPLRGGAHVPYLEETDFSIARPFLNADVSQSIAVYAWLDSPGDVDVYLCWVTEPTRLFAEILVPVCEAYRDFYPSFAVLGPDLPAPSIPLAGRYRVAPVVWQGANETRETFFEPFGGKHYYQGPGFDRDVSAPGLYAILVWDPQGSRGDYVLPIGLEERWPLLAILRALAITPKIRLNEELHSTCVEGPAAAPPAPTQP